MKEQEEKRGGWGCAVALAILLVVFLPAAYVLSTGPFQGLYERGYMSMETADAIANILYAPLRFVTYRCKPLEDFVLWWDSLFRPA
jgi:hypothetical protein